MKQKQRDVYAMSRRDLAETLLRKADQDQMVFEKLRLDQDVAVDILGFHAQQAAEKMLKSTLAGQEIDFPFSHRLTDLFDLLKENGVSIPEDFEELRFLTPFAVAFRYELYEEEEEPFDSDRVAALLVKLRQWVVASLPATEDDETPNAKESTESPDESE
ncbi:MAG TPA: HEPN domain-containing protein [Thermoanaerobaculia bacterium]|nr:HEPN domain-containing protein [Thermoanaerobaculia bacterium]